MIGFLLKIISTVTSVYLLACFIRILMSWFPTLAYSPFGQLLCKICDPYLNLFRKLPLRIGGLDFSPIISLGLLSILSTSFDLMARTNRISLFPIIYLLISLLSSAIQSIAIIVVLALLIRYIAMCVSNQTTRQGSAWNYFDMVFSRMIYRISNFVTRNRPVSYKTACLFSIIFLTIIFTFLVMILNMILYAM